MEATWWRCKGLYFLVDFADARRGGILGKPLVTVYALQMSTKAQQAPRY